MFFSRKPKTATLRYLLFFDKVAKYEYVLSNLPEPSQVVISSFFESTKNEMTQLLNAKGFEHTFSPNHEISSTSGSPIWIMDLHPMRSEILKIRDRLTDQHEIVFFIGIDEPVMKLFGQERLPRLMEKLGMKREDAIEHSMVSRSIERAQEKLEEQIANHKDIKTSPEEWVKANSV